MSSESFVHSCLLPSHTTDTIFDQGCEHTCRHTHVQACTRMQAQTPESQARKLLTKKHLDTKRIDQG